MLLQCTNKLLIAIISAAVALRKLSLHVAQRAAAETQKDKGVQTESQDRELQVDRRSGGYIHSDGLLIASSFSDDVDFVDTARKAANKLTSAHAS